MDGCGTSSIVTDALLLQFLSVTSLFDNCELKVKNLRQRLTTLRKNNTQKTRCEVGNIKSDTLRLPHYKGRALRSKQLPVLSPGGKCFI